MKYLPLALICLTQTALADQDQSIQLLKQRGFSITMSNRRNPQSYDLMAKHTSGLKLQLSVSREVTATDALAKVIRAMKWNRSDGKMVPEVTTAAKSFPVRIWQGGSHTHYLLNAVADKNIIFVRLMTEQKKDSKGKWFARGITKDELGWAYKFIQKVK